MKFFLSMAGLLYIVLIGVVSVIGIVLFANRHHLYFLDVFIPLIVAGLIQLIIMYLDKFDVK